MNAECLAEFTVPLSDQKVTENETAVFECEVTKPDLKPTWRKDGEDITPSKRCEPSSIGKKHMLTIREAQMDDQSPYTIVVEEGVEATAKLTVKGT